MCPINILNVAFVSWFQYSLCTEKNRQSKRDRVKQRDLGQLCSILILAVECDVDGAVILT